MRRVRQLGELEAVVMETLWSASGPLSVREVMEALPAGRDRAYTTVMTVLDNLYRKNVVDRRREGRAYRYLPLHSREEHTATLLDEVLSSSGDRQATLLHFVEHMSPEETDRLKKILDDLGRVDR